jgi:UDP-N-acetylmuramyl pentapeptide phosphotransferase/UDP-N-acetylglucosamine-1-phosphate transferase
MSFNLIILDHINNLIIASSLLIVFYLLLIMLPNKFTIYRKYSSLLKIHQHDIPRLGGFGIFIFLYFFNYLSGKTIFLDSLIIASLPLFFVMVKEDVFHNTKPINRIIFTFISFILFINLFQLHLPNLTFEVLNIFFDYSYLFKLFFFFLCLVFLLNGNNLVDGTNGLLIATIIVQILCLLFFSFMFLDYELFFNLFLLLVPVFIF